ncbi:hypothetical protein JOB18_023130 [Solea senegalensis]|uniref:Uncharacterized protein n=1 Tax=Solea senegalensis TaxID=28829 RepID=A0AAV6RBF3_SOLSE|nr:hypothetical protein JOB18_023130 [Solea senegalensis]
MACELSQASTAPCWPQTEISLSFHSCVDTVMLNMSHVSQAALPGPERHTVYVSAVVSVRDNKSLSGCVNVSCGHRGLRVRAFTRRCLLFLVALRSYQRRLSEEEEEEGMEGCGFSGSTCTRVVCARSRGVRSHQGEAERRPHDPHQRSEVKHLAVAAQGSPPSSASPPLNDPRRQASLIPPLLLIKAAGG